MLSSADEGEHIPWNGFDGQPVHWADPADPLPHIDWSESTSAPFILTIYYISEFFAALAR